MSYNPGPGFIRTSSFQYRQTFQRFHNGVDYGAKAGSNIPAATDGQVWYSGFNNTYGNTVILQHIGKDGNIYFTLYAHMNGVGMPELGVSIRAGDVIGQVGNSGSASRGNHLHFEVIDPTNDIPSNFPSNANGGPIGIPYGKFRVDPDMFVDWPLTGAFDWRTSSIPPTTDCKIFLQAAGLLPVVLRQAGCPVGRVRRGAGDP
jgi:murein DD-endopeptidase MepM/ murein hydrolase activator NlpD